MDKVLSKEEILMDCGDSYLSPETMEAMSIYANQEKRIEAIAFAKWILQNAYIAEDEYFYELLSNGTKVSEQTLYEMFEYEQSKNKTN